MCAALHPAVFPVCQDGQQGDLAAGWFRAPTALYSNTGFTLTGYKAFSKLFYISMPQFPHLFNGDKNNYYIIDYSEDYIK